MPEGASELFEPAGVRQVGDDAVRKDQLRTELQVRLLTVLIVFRDHMPDGVLFCDHILICLDTREKKPEK